MIFLRDYYKRQGAIFSDMPVSYTRQEIANMLGLRVETVIRALTSLKMSKKVAIRNHKLYLINGNE
jgi:CRP-like cAMP-binding protein